MESATSFRAAILSSSLVRIAVVRGGMSSSGFGGGGVSFVDGCDMLAVAVIEREEGGRVYKGGRVWEL